MQKDPKVHKNYEKSVLITLVLTVFLLTFVEVPRSSANSSPNPFTSQGQSWVNVPNLDRIYLENFGSSNRDDANLRYVASGVSCTFNSIFATGPFLTPVDLNGSHCTQSGVSYDPINDATRLGALPIGFAINFFGTTYSSLWPSTNGGVYFDSPQIQYEDTLPHLAFSAGSSVLFMLGADQVYRANKSNFWMAQTTINSIPAFVLSWENFDTWGNVNEKFSYQLVILNYGSGDFDAWFNYDSLANFDNQFGYQSPYFLIDAKNDVTENSNVVVGAYSNTLPSVCTYAFRHIIGNPSNNPLSTGFYFKLENNTARTISLWTDSSCSTPLNFTSKNNEATNGKAFYEIYVDDSSRSIGIGWSTYNQTTKEISTTELVSNASVSELINGGSDQIIAKSLNTTTPGRFIIGQRSGATTMNVNSDTATSGNSSADDGKWKIKTDVESDCVTKSFKINFDGGSSHLDKNALKKIKNISSEITRCGFTKVKLDGYTSIDKQDSPNYKIFRKNLSFARASKVEFSIKSNLKNKYKSLNFQKKALSEKNPIKSNRSEETRPANRRVEVTLSK